MILLLTCTLSSPVTMPSSDNFCMHRVNSRDSSGSNLQLFKEDTSLTVSLGSLSNANDDTDEPLMEIIPFSFSSSCKKKFLIKE